MSEPPDLDTLYAEAQSAIAAKDPKRATALLKQILLNDENHKDASRLLAQVVARQRRRWYRDWRLAVAVVAIGLSLWLWRTMRSANLGGPAAAPALPASSASVSTPSDPALPTQTISAPSVTSAAEAIPLQWTRLAVGEQFTRDEVTAIVMDPTDSDVLYVGTKHGGIYKSIDGGLSWRPAHTGLETASIATLVIDPADTRTLYAGTLLGGVYATSDGGENWGSMNQGLTPTEWSAHISTVALDPLDTRHLYYLDENLYETWAGSDRWQSVIDGEIIGERNPCQPTFQDMAAHPLQPHTLLVTDGGGLGCAPGIYTLHTDSGSRTLLFGTGPSDRLRDLEVDGLSGRYLHVTGWDEKGALIYSSSDGGETWVENRLQYGGWSCRSIAISPANGEIAYCASEGGLYRTSDAGKTWRARIMWPRQGSRGDFNMIEQYIEAEDRRIFLAREGLTVSQDEGTSWEPRLNGLGATFLQLKLRPNRTNVLYLEEGSCIFGTRHDTNLYVSQDGGFTWTLEVDRGCGAAFSLDGELIYRIDPSSAAVLQSLGGGVRWTTLPLSESNVSPIDLSTLPPDPGILFVASHYGAASEVSYDNGSTWVSTELREGRLVLAYDDQGEAIYAFSTSGDGYRSATKGATWSACERVGFRPSEIGTQFAVVHSGDSEHVLVGTRGGGVMVSRDGCRTWRPSNNNLGSLFVNALATDPNDPEIIYASTDGGAYVSFDGGVTWGEINEGLLGATVVYSIVVDPESNVYAATPYGIFRLEAR